PTYRNSFPNASTPAIPSPSPLYGGENDDLPPSRFKILPREEEGREELPPYTCSLHREAMFERKMELQSPFERAHKRRWKKCYLVLHGTKLEVHKARKIPWFARGLKKADPSKPAGWRAGPLLESYTLQLGEVGTATDYKKRHFAIRLRVQAVQFLISCRTLESYLDWLEALSAAIDVSPSLEERSLPRYQTLPRRRRRRVVVTADTAAPLTTTTTGATASADAAQQQLDNIANSLQLTPNRGVTPAAAGTTQPAVRSTAAEPEEHAFDEAGKWAPQSRITREANMRFARRCMAVLCADSPRQSEFVVVKGKRYRIMWETKKMVPAEAEADAP
ncbi:hypothetical protein BZA05DRAFT_318830, partial [Tricharina praecox]|uniref:uncharacterized protein n=1 Tax=Tricharina praecox TaxID=43433 RepID=UPI00221F9129